MSSLVEKVIAIGGVTIGALILLGVLFTSINKGKDFTESANDKLTSMSIAVEESDYTRYDGAIVTGSDVVSAIKYFDSTDDVCITVTTSKGTNNFIFTGPDLSTPSDISVANTRDKTSQYYINPGSKFLGECVRDSDGTITNIIFTVQTTP